MLPNNIRIGSIDYSVNITKGLSAGEGLYGQIQYGTASIRLEDGLAPSRLRDVLAHELAHGLLFEAGYDDHEEEMANRLGKVLAMVLRDNDFGFMREGEADE